MTESKSEQDSFSDGMAKLAEATRQGMTASRLALAGVAALGAGGSVYFSDPERREAFLKSMSRMTDGLTTWWSNLSKADQGPGSTTAGAEKAASGAPPNSDSPADIPPGAHSG